jgi:NitT/TauT family transport system substrate-binding protein
MVALKFRAIACALAAFMVTSAAATAEVSDVKIARQYGIGYLPMMIMERDHLLEKEAAKLGLPGLHVTWATFAGAGPMNDAMLSGDLHFAAVGTTSLPILWARTRGTPQEIKGVCGLSSVPLYLNTRVATIKSVKDFTDKDKIALPAVKVSTMAVVLQMAAAQAFGPKNYDKLDHLTISRSHPDGMIALLSGAGEIDSHFTWPPYNLRELKTPGIHTVLDSESVMGGPASTVVIITSKRFHDANPKVYAAFLAAMREADDIIGRDKPHAAEVYLQATKDKESVDEIAAMLNPAQFTITPENVMKFTDFLLESGVIKQKPSSWKELFFPEIHDLPGS